MEPFLKSELFFFISSVGFVVIGLLVSVLLVYGILIAHKLLALTKLAKEKGEEVGETITFVAKTVTEKTEEIGDAITDVQDFIRHGTVLHWIAYFFGSRAKKSTSRRTKVSDEE